MMEKRIVNGTFKLINLSHQKRIISADILLNIVTIIIKLDICKEAIKPTLTNGHLRVYWYE